MMPTDPDSDSTATELSRQLAQHSAAIRPQRPDLAELSRRSRVAGHRNWTLRAAGVAAAFLLIVAVGSQIMGGRFDRGELTTVGQEPDGQDSEGKDAPGHPLAGPGNGTLLLDSSVGTLVAASSGTRPFGEPGISDHVISYVSDSPDRPDSWLAIEVGEGAAIPETVPGELREELDRDGVRGKHFELGQGLSALMFELADGRAGRALARQVEPDQLFASVASLTITDGAWTVTAPPEGLVQDYSGPAPAAVLASTTSYVVGDGATATITTTDATPAVVATARLSVFRVNADIPFPQRKIEWALDEPSSGSLLTASPLGDDRAVWTRVSEQDDFLVVVQLAYPIPSTEGMRRSALVPVDAATWGTILNDCRPADETGIDAGALLASGAPLPLANIEDCRG